jgi:hypothetical protein
LSRLFTDGFGIAYDATNGKYVSALFGQTASSPNPNAATFPFTTNATAYAPFNFTTAAVLQQKADLTALGNMNDCAECHVGGGAMEYIPKYIADGSVGSPLQGTADPAQRIPLRTAGTTGGILDTLVSSFNYLIDVFGPKGDGKGATYTAIKNDFAQSGVLEMDCLVCHLKNYSWEERKSAVRARGFDASRVTGAGFGSYSTSATPSSTVTYDPAKVVFANGADDAGGYKLASTVTQNILAVPDSGNCASCHAATVKEKFQVEWKKRGDFWGGSEVHGGFGCMGCHERNDLTVNGAIDKTKVGTTGLANSANKKLSLCDPAKGGDSGYDAQWNAMDKVAFKNCADCHLGTAGNGKTYGAPNPTTAHQNAGLLAKIAQKQYDSTGLMTSNGVANVSHLDIIDCTVCHSRKADATVALYNADGTFKNYTTFKITGGAMVDGTGKDEEGRLATHDTTKVERDMYDNYALYWNGGKLFLGNMLTSFFWRDMNTLYDANMDGRGPGLDPILQTHVAQLNPEALMKDGIVDSTEIGTHITNIASGLPALNGNATDTPIIKLAALAVPFKWTHNIAPASQALGKNCADCHDAGSTFLNKKIVVSPKTNFTYSSGQMVNFTKVNGLTQATDMHPNVVNKAGNRSVAVPIFTPTAAGNLSDDSQAVQRAAMIYEGTFTNQDRSWKASAVTGSTRSAVGQANSPWYDSANKTTGSAGWVLKIQERDAGAATFVERSFSVSNNTLTNVDGLIAHMGGFAINYGFTITNGGSENLVITPKAGKEIRLSPQTDVGPLGLTALWTGEPITGVNGTPYATRAAWLTYFNGITAAGSGIGINPVAAFHDTITTATVGTSVTFEAETPASAGFFTYVWIFGDGTSSTVAGIKTVAKTYTTAGTYTVTLKVTDEEGKTDLVQKTVMVSPATAVVAVGTPVVTPATLVTAMPLNTLPAHNKVYVSWGDGTSMTIFNPHTDATIDLSHKFSRISQYLVTPAAPAVPYYKYTTTVKYYNGSSLVQQTNLTVKVNKNAEVDGTYISTAVIP